MPGICLIFNKETKDKINGIYQQIDSLIRNLSYKDDGSWLDFVSCAI